MIRRSTVVPLVAVAAAVSFGNLSAQIGWADRSASPPGRSGAGFEVESGRHPAMAFDTNRARAVMFIGETWEWDGVSWTVRDVDGSPPPPRQQQAMAYDEARGEVVMFGGGIQGSTFYNDTWTWDGKRWTRRTPATVPPRRGGHMMAYDDVRGEVVMFGGYDYISIFSGIVYRDTWTWNGSDWTLRSPTNTPPARAWTAMAWDPIRQEILLGCGALGATCDTWVWNGTDWAQRFPANAPPNRLDHGLAHDPSTGGMLMFGGDTNGPGTANDTWLWDGTDWSQLSPNDSPSARTEFAMTTDVARGTVVVAGGEFLSDTWEWGGGDWTERVPPIPQPRTNQPMTYDSGRNVVVMHAGDSDGLNVSLRDTWEWDGTSWQQATSIGPFASGGAMTYDAARAVSVLFSAGQTWEWDGATWIQRQPGDLAAVALRPRDGLRRRQPARRAVRRQPG